MPMRLFKKKISLDVLKEAYLQMAIKALNDFIGPNSLVPTLLIFSTFPQILDSDIPALLI